MPVIKLWGLSTECSKHDCAEIKERIVEAVVAIEELHVSARDITCIFPLEVVVEDSLFEVTIEVTGLFAKPERTDEVRDKLAAALGEVIERSWEEKDIPKPDLVECFVHPFDQKQGFWSSTAARSKKHYRLHGEIVEGVVQIMLAQKKKGEGLTFKELHDAGCVGRSPEASEIISQIFKARAVKMDPESLEMVARQNYALVKDSVTNYLARTRREWSRV